MTVVNINKTIKSTALILLASTLMACQDDTSASGGLSAETVVESDTPKELTQAASPSIAVGETVKETVVEDHYHNDHAVETSTIKSAPKPPADFSKLDSSKYQAVSQEIPVSTGEKIEITELFWFGCGHCFALEAPLKAWLKTKPDNAKFKKVPAVFSKRWEFHAQAFYTMEALNVPESAYDEFFKDIHLRKKALNNIKALVTFLDQYGKDKATVENAFNSFAVDSKVRNAIRITKASGARGVPAIVVDGKYLTSQSNAGGTGQMFDVVEQLVAKAASER